MPAGFFLPSRKEDHGGTLRLSTAQHPPAAMRLHRDAGQELRTIRQSAHGPAMTLDLLFPHENPCGRD